MALKNYAFANVNASIVGPNAAFSMGFGSGLDDGGISVEFAEPRVGMKAGADGQAMVSFYSQTLGKIIIRVQKTAPVNALLSAMFAADSADPTQVGQNTILVSDLALVDLCAGKQCAIEKHPNIVYGKEGPMNEWTFLVGQLRVLLGGGGI